MKLACLNVAMLDGKKTVEKGINSQLKKGVWNHVYDGGEHIFTQEKTGCTFKLNSAYWSVIDSELYLDNYKKRCELLLQERVDE